MLRLETMQLVCLLQLLDDVAPASRVRAAAWYVLVVGVDNGAVAQDLFAPFGE